MMAKKCPYCNGELQTSTQKNARKDEYECPKCAGVWNCSEETYHPVYYPKVIEDGLSSASENARKAMRKIGKNEQ
jgi:Zn-finger nucleic acid-binding protein